MWDAIRNHIGKLESTFALRARAVSGHEGGWGEVSEGEATQGAHGTRSGAPWTRAATNIPTPHGVRAARVIIGEVANACSRARGERRPRHALGGERLTGSSLST